MLTLFTHTKKFEGHSGLIQRNAIRAWTQLRPRPEIIIFGEDDVEGVARELGVTAGPRVARNAHGTPLVSDLYAKAQQLSSAPILCYSNADIILFNDLLAAIDRVRDRRPLLLAGRRCELDVRQPLDVSQAGWDARLRDEAARRGVVKWHGAIDYFVFTSGLFADIPPLAIGRWHFDNALLYLARTRGAILIDASPAVLAIHQNHDYGYHPKGMQWIHQGPESSENMEMAGGWRNMYTLAESTHILAPNGLRPNLHPLRLQRALERVPVIGALFRFGARVARKLASLAQPRPAAS